MHLTQLKPIVLYHVIVSCHPIILYPRKCTSSIAILIIVIASHLISYRVTLLLYFHTCSGYKGLTPSYQNFVDLVDVIFCGKAYPAKFDSAMYVNMYTVSKEVDIGELQLTLSLAHLVQQEILSFLTPTYGTYKVGRIDEDALTKAIKNLKSDLNGNIAEASAGMEEAPDDNTKLLEVIIPLVEHIRTHQKRKWCSLDVIELANKLNCKPNVILLCAGAPLTHSLSIIIAITNRDHPNQ
jgi:hypothetical protein